MKIIEWQKWLSDFLSNIKGNGLMSEALKSVIEFCFSKTELQKIWTDVHILNHVSYKTLEKVGFQREGHIRGGKMVNTYCDYYLYGIFKNLIISLADVMANIEATIDEAMNNTVSKVYDTKSINRYLMNLLDMAH